MKPQTQALMVALAITFAIGLAITVALICLAFVKDGCARNLPVSREEQSIEVYNPALSGSGDRTSPSTKTPTTQGSSQTTAPFTSIPSQSTSNSAATEEPKNPGNGLLYISNGDGSCQVLSVGSCLDACVVIPEYSPGGDRVTSVASRAFYNCSTVSAIQIPSGIVQIGDLAFAGCKNLVYISVSSQNTAYCDADGVLYSKDRNRLILYPPMRAGSTATIPVSVCEIAEMAFYNCTYLRSIVYTGTPAQWEQIQIAPKNYSLTAASKSFGTKSGK